VNRLKRLAFLVVGALLAGSVCAQSYPNKPINPYAAGGGVEWGKIAKDAGIKPQ